MIKKFECGRYYGPNDNSRVFCIIEHYFDSIVIVEFDKNYRGRKKIGGIYFDINRRYKIDERLSYLNNAETVYLSYDKIIITASNEMVWNGNKFV